MGLRIEIFNVVFTLSIVNTCGSVVVDSFEEPDSCISIIIIPVSFKFSYSHASIEWGMGTVVN